jgi:hypothetical protein
MTNLIVLFANFPGVCMNVLIEKNFTIRAHIPEGLSLEGSRAAWGL